MTSDNFSIVPNISRRENFIGSRVGGIRDLKIYDAVATTLPHYRKFRAVWLSRSRRTMWEKYPKKLVRAVSE